MKEAILSMMKRLQTAWLAWSRVPETASAREEVWFAGLAVAPDDFSSQLSRLQTSLHRENAPVVSSSPPVRDRVTK
jgi:hypothetical protein